MKKCRRRISQSLVLKTKSLKMHCKPYLLNMMKMYVCLLTRKFKSEKVKHLQIIKQMKRGFEQPFQQQLSQFQRALNPLFKNSIELESELQVLQITHNELRKEYDQKVLVCY
jgi:hypothetical protein